MSTLVYTKKPSIIAAILLTWLMAGTFDGIAVILWAAYYTHTISLEVFRNVASGVFGNMAMTGGEIMVVLGILLHYFIALCFTVVWFLSYPLFNSILRYKVIIAIFYGIATWAIMEFVVKPLSNVPKHPLQPTIAITGCVILVFTIGLTITLMAHAYYYKIKGRLLYL
jgi:hypothetical protein